MSDNYFWRDSSRRLTFSMGTVPVNDYPPLCGGIIASFGLTSSAELVTNGVDIVFMQYRRGEQAVCLDWDHWMGLMVAAQTPASEPLVREIAEWLLDKTRLPRGLDCLPEEGLVET